jgi:hypothetical protein
MGQQFTATLPKSYVGIQGQRNRDYGTISISIPKLIRSRFRDEADHGFRF